jgi:hypothetical protein
MYVLILTLFMTPTTPGAMTSAEFSSQETCQKAANAWKMQAKLILGNVKLSTVCMPK